MNTFIFISALILSAMSANDYVASVMEFKMMDNKKYNLKTPFIKSMISCVLWGAFYYITTNVR